MQSLEQSVLVQLKLSQPRQIRLRKIFLKQNTVQLFELLLLTSQSYISVPALQFFFHQLQLFKYPSTLQAGMHIHLNLINKLFQYLFFQNNNLFIVYKQQPLKSNIFLYIEWPLKILSLRKQEEFQSSELAPQVGGASALDQKNPTIMLALQ